MKQDLLYLKKLFSKPFRIVKAGGQTNRNYIVTLENKKFFVRLPWENAVLNRSIEGENIMRLSRNKKLKSILPKYYFYILKKKNILDPKSRERFDVPDGAMMIEYIAGREFTLKDFKLKKYQKALAKMLYTFHSSGVRFVNPYDVFRDEIEKYRKEAMKFPFNELIGKDTTSLLKEIEKKARKEIPVSSKGISTHNDFIFSNLLIGEDEKIYPLDFEYAGFNKRGGLYYEIGYLFGSNLFLKERLSKELFEKFLHVAEKVYKRKFHRRKLYLCALAAILVMSWWGVVRYFSVPLKERPYFKEYVQVRTRGLLDVYGMLK